MYTGSPATPPHPNRRNRLFFLNSICRSKYLLVLVQMDCFYVGRLRGVKGAVWQYTAIDVASSYTWAQLWTTPRNPAALRTGQLARRVAQDLSMRGWKLQAVMTDNASEYRSKVFRATYRRTRRGT